MIFAFQSRRRFLRYLSNLLALSLAGCGTYCPPIERASVAKTVEPFLRLKVKVARDAGLKVSENGINARREKLIDEWLPIVQRMQDTWKKETGQCITEMSLPLLDKETKDLKIQ